jgi:transcriptional regulator with XRE-family HTH domain
MGTNPRARPQRLAVKLRHIRLTLNLTQAELLRQLDVEGLATQSKISEYESGKRDPSLLILLQYSRLAGVHMEDLVDDKTDLPAKLPAKLPTRQTRR